MSGGSFEHLHNAAGDLPGLTGPGRLRDLQAMADLLDALPDDSAGAATRMVLAHLKAAETLSFRLREVWRAAEWYMSGDGALADVHRAAAEYKQTLTGAQAPQ